LFVCKWGGNRLVSAKEPERQTNGTHRAELSSFARHIPGQSPPGLAGNRISDAILYLKNKTKKKNPEL
jgi:hypothetical protein